MDAFAQRLLDWYDRHGRHDLPWQRDATPYHVWLSEIMLQQTQVNTVIPYYERFTSAFPSLQALAAADEDAVLRHWSGLGYYARARNLHRAARQLVQDYSGGFPADLRQLQGLPGIGRSTAGAILSSALGGRAPILDGNVKRVLARYHGIAGWPGRSAVAKRLWELAEEHTPRERVADYTQAIMDLGATLCRRSRPECDRCPQRTDCIARKQGRQDEFPGRKPRRALPTRSTCFLMASTPQRELILERRAPSGIWGGLWCFPEVEDESAARHFCEVRLGAAVLNCREMTPLQHSFTHFRLEISPLLLTLSRSPAVVQEGAELRSWPLAALPDTGIAAPTKTLWLTAREAMATTEN